MFYFIFRKAVKNVILSMNREKNPLTWLRKESQSLSLSPRYISAPQVNQKNYLIGPNSLQSSRDSLWASTNLLYASFSDSSHLSKSFLRGPLGWHLLSQLEKTMSCKLCKSLAMLLVAERRHMYTRVFYLYGYMHTSCTITYVCVCILLPHCAILKHGFG